MKSVTKKPAICNLFRLQTPAFGHFLYLTINELLIEGTFLWKFTLKRDASGTGAPSSVREKRKQTGKYPYRVYEFGGDVNGKGRNDAWWSAFRSGKTTEGNTGED